MSDPMRILLVDASTVFLDMMGTAFAPHATEVLTAISLGQARQLLDSKEVDFVVCEARLPDGSGLELLEREPRPRVVILATHHVDREEKRASDLGALGYLSKPTSYRAIARVLERHKRGDWHPARRVRRRSLGKAYVADLHEPERQHRGMEPFQLVWDIHDIGVTGAFLETRGPLEVDTQLDLGLVLERSGVARVKAKVVRVQYPSWTHVGGVGVVFTWFGLGARDLLERYVADADGELL